MRDVPKGWAETTVGLVTVPVQKTKPRDRPHAQFDYIDIGGIDPERAVIAEAKAIIGAEAPSRARQVVREGDTVLSTVRVNLRKTAIVPQALDGAVASTGFSVLRPAFGVDPRFLLYQVIEAGFVEALSTHQTGSSYPAVRDQDVRSMPFRLAPLGEQERIVAAIEDHFSHLDAAEASLHRARRSLDRLRLSILMELCSGDWPVRQLGDIATGVRNGMFVSRPSTAPPGVPIFRISAVRPLALDVADVRYAEVSADEAVPFQVVEGDVLFTRYSGNPSYVGACAVVPPGAAGILHPDKLIRVSLDRSVALPAWVAISLSVGAGRAQIAARLKTTAGQVGIAGGQLKTVQVPLPPIEEQAHRISRWDAASDQMSTMSSAIEGATRRASNLRRSILADAFAGQLVVPDPTDESASALLERIREAASTSSSPRKRSQLE
jgi:type I restriction enzyme S subunit